MWMLRGSSSAICRHMCIKNGIFPDEFSYRFDQLSSGFTIVRQCWIVDYRDAIARGSIFSDVYEYMRSGLRIVSVGRIYGLKRDGNWLVPVTLVEEISRRSAGSSNFRETWIFIRVSAEQLNGS